MNSLERPEASKSGHLQNRVLLVYLLVALWGVVLVGRLVHLQVFQHEEYSRWADHQRAGYVELSPRRGDILDRNLEDLAISVRMDAVFAQPTDIEKPRRTARLLASLLDQSEEELYARLTSDRSFVFLSRRATPRQVADISELKLPGIYFQKENRRVYPNRELAAHVLGFVGVDNEGLSGIEYLYDEQIRGRRSRVHLRVDARRRSYTSQIEDSETDGNQVVLNLDRNIQFIAEQVLAETVASTRALNGSAIVLDPHTGEVLAMASYPPFNSNNYGDSDPEDRRNRAILEIFEPGSTFKIVTVSAVLNEGLTHLDEVVDCRVGTLRLAGKVYREARRSFGDLKVQEIVAKSSNVGTIKLGLRLGEERFYEYIRRFGFGARTGIELPGEEPGLLRPPSRWSRISIGALSIGQELGVTPLQMVRAMSVFANGGYLIRPQLVRRILTPSGGVVFENEPDQVRILEETTVRKMRQTLTNVVETGTGQSARLSGYTSAGKTGTAQKFIAGRYSPNRFIASYVGFAPLENPALAAVVVINEPRGEYFGGLVAAPAFKQIMERALIHLKVPRDEPETTPVSRPRFASRELPSAVGVSDIIEEEPPLDRLDETVLTLIAEQDLYSASTGSIRLDTGWFPLPDFAGMTLREVARECARLELDLRVSGSGRAVGQQPAPGSRVLPGTECEVFFSPGSEFFNASGNVALGKPQVGAGRTGR